MELKSSNSKIQLDKLTVVLEDKQMKIREDYSQTSR